MMVLISLEPLGLQSTFSHMGGATVLYLLHKLLDATLQSSIHKFSMIWGDIDENSIAVMVEKYQERL